jgi:hypothetical protein
VNPEGVSAWLPGQGCLWQREGVWDVGPGGRPRLLRPQHFSYVGGRFVEFGRHYWRPFLNRAAATVRAEHPEALIFVQPEYGAMGPAWGRRDAERIVYEPHWYDLVTLFLKRYIPGLALDLTRRGPVFGVGQVERHFAHELREHIRHGRERMAGAPTLFGEFGIPFDLNGRAVYSSGNYGTTERAMARSFQAMDDALASGTIWNYTADHSAAHGDQWNDEDLSIYSPEQRGDPADPNAGGRALRAVVRPYAIATAGTPLRMRFDVWSRVFRFRFRHDPDVTAPTEIFVPRIQYPNGCRVHVSDGEIRLDMERQLLRYRHSPDVEEHELRIAPR